MEILKNCYLIAESTDKYYDPSHDSKHCLKVWAWIKKYYENCESGLGRDRELRILQAAALFHEQNDAKFGRNVEEIENDLRIAMREDGLLEEDIEIVIELIKNCSFKKRKFRKIKENLVKMMDLLCAADLAEAVGSKAIDRSFEFHKARILRDEKRTPTNEEVWRHVIEFVEVQNKDGYMDRFEAIVVEKIKEEVSLIIEKNMQRIAEIKKKINNVKK